MAKVTGPLYSVSASGTVAKSFTFGVWKGIQWVRGWVKGANPNTSDQQIVRARVTAAVGSWHDEDGAVKSFWDDEAASLAMSGYNLYVKRYVEYMRDNAEAEPANTDVNPMTGA